MLRRPQLFCWSFSTASFSPELLCSFPSFLSASFLCTVRYCTANNSSYLCLNFFSHGCEKYCGKSLSSPTSHRLCVETCWKRWMVNGFYIFSLTLIEFFKSFSSFEKYSVEAPAKQSSALKQKFQKKKLLYTQIWTPCKGEGGPGERLFFCWKS